MAEKALSLVTPQDTAIVTKKDLDEWLFGTGTRLTEQQKALFYKVCLASNLNPIKKEVYAIPYGNNFNIITGYEVYLKRAERTGLLEWWEAGVKKEDNELVGWCTIKRTDRTKETTIEAWFNEYNQNNAMWKAKPRTMIRKVAIAQAFRMVFSDELGGLPYTNDELPANEPRELEFVPLETVTDKDAEVVAQEDLTARRQSAIDYLKKKGKGIEDGENFLKTSYQDWTQEDLDALKKWIKDGFPAGDIPL